MLTDFSVRCPHEGCNWKGYLIPSATQGGSAADILNGKRGWFRCQACGKDWSATIQGDELRETELTDQTGTEREV